MQVLLSRNLEGKARKQVIYHPPPSVLPVWEPPAAHVWLYLVLLVAILAHLATNMSQHTPKDSQDNQKWRKDGPT